ncbi:MAG: MMPL family transporter [Verrucomicrobiota bacterium]
MSLETRFARFTVRRPRWTVFAVVAFAVACAFLIKERIAVDTDILNLLPQRFDSVRSLKVYDREFTQARELTFALWDESGSLDLDAFTEQFGDALRKEPWAKRVLDRSPMDSTEGTREIQTLAVPLLLNLEPTAFSEAIGLLQPQALTQRLAKKRAEIEAGSPKAEMELNFDPLGLVVPALKPLSGSFSLDGSRPLVSTDGTLRVVVVATNQRGLDALTCQEIMRQVEGFKTRFAATWSGPAPQVLVTGRTAYVGEMSLGMKHDIVWTVIGSVVLVAGVFYFGFRRLRPLLAILGVLLLCCLAAVMAGTFAFPNGLNVVTMGLCSILVGLGVDFGMLLYGTYQTGRNSGEDHETASVNSVKLLGRGILFGSATTAVAFVSLVLSESPGFAQLGVLIAIGIVLAAVLMMSVFYVLVGRGHVPGGHDFLFEATQSYCDRLFRSPKPVMAVTAAALVLLTLFACLPVGTVRFEANPQSLEPANSKAGFALRKIKEKLSSGGVEPVLAIIKAKDARDFHAQWTAAQQRWQAAKERGEIRNFSTPAAFALSPERLDANLAQLASVDFAATRQAFTKALEQGGFDPASFGGAFSMLDALSALAHGDRTPADWRAALPERSIWRFVLERFLSTTPNVGAAYITPNKTIASAQEQQAVRKVLEGPGIDAHLTGWSYVMADLVPWSKSKLMELSFVMVLFNIALLVLLYRAVGPLLVLMISLALSIGAMIAGLKITGLSLNLFNVLAFPLVLGVGVDYGIYIVLAVRQRGHHTRALPSIVKPVILSGLTTTAGFASLGLANNPALSSLGLVCALGVGCCLFSTLFLILPAYLWKGYK